MPVATSWITYTETTAALGAAWRLGRITRGQLRAHVRTLDADWGSVTALAVDRPVAESAGAVAVRCQLRGMDALHVASALALHTARPVLVTWDARLARAAHAEGLAVAGISLG